MVNTNNDLSSNIAILASKIETTLYSTYVPPPDRFLDYVDVDPVAWGLVHVKRPLANPDQHTFYGREWNLSTMQKRAIPLVQDLDIPKNMHRFMATEEDMGQYPTTILRNAEDLQKVFYDGMDEAILVGGIAGGTMINPPMYGVKYTTGGTAGTVNIAEVVSSGSIATAGAWGTIANMQSDFIKAVSTLESEKFFGQKVIVAPPLVRSMFWQQLVNTAIPVEQWIQSVTGMPIVFDPFLHQAAVSTNFDVIVVDMDRIHLAMTPLQTNSFYDQDNHQFKWDMECGFGVEYDVLYNSTSTEYHKGVALLSARSWT